jgi:predicted DNA-binding transcriptional regulator AlpA
MEGISLVETKTLQALIFSVEDMKMTVVSTLAELKEAKKPYLTAQDVMELTGFGKTWVNDNKQDIGFSMVGGCLRFKRKDVEEYMNQNYFKAKKK